jgi:hypothetical protein
MNTGINSRSRVLKFALLSILVGTVIGILEIPILFKPTMVDFWFPAFCIQVGGGILLALFIAAITSNLRVTFVALQIAIGSTAASAAAFLTFLWALRH